MKAAAILEETLARNPEHTGALHYLIHCYDDPVHAPLGLRAARLYAKVAPQSAHALHMPAHIFVAMGMWDEAVASNEASWAASEARVKRKRLPLENRGFHSLWWLEYSYLQQGRFEDARRALSTVEQDAKTSPSRLVRFHLAQMRAAYMIETGQHFPAPVDTADLDLPAVAADLLAAGIVAANRGERAEAERSLSRLRTFARQAAPGTNGQKHNHVFAGDTQTIDIATNELEAMLLMADGKTDNAIEAMKKAIAVEDSMTFEFGPPSPPKPAHELFGEILLQLGRAEEARRQFELALARSPKRALSVLGLARALAQSGNAAAARQSYTELREIWRRADKDLRKAIDETVP
jgi:tetratricopeptide (TPR) repeat protein